MKILAAEKSMTRMQKASRIVWKDWWKTVDVRQVFITAKMMNVAQHSAMSFSVGWEWSINDCRSTTLCNNKR